MREESRIEKELWRRPGKNEDEKTRVECDVGDEHAHSHAEATGLSRSGASERRTDDQARGCVGNRVEDRGGEDDF